MLSTFAIALLDQWVVREPIGFCDSRFKIVDDNHLRDATEPGQIRFRYVVVLLLMRRKRLKFEDTIRKADGTEALVVRDTRNGKKLEVLDPRLNETELEAVQAEVFQLLGWEP